MAEQERKTLAEQGARAQDGRVTLALLIKVEIATAGVVGERLEEVAGISEVALEAAKVAIMDLAEEARALLDRGQESFTRAHCSRLVVGVAASRTGLLSSLHCRRPRPPRAKPPRAVATQPSQAVATRLFPSSQASVGASHSFSSC